jgi:hypothetical protein
MKLLIILLGSHIARLLTNRVDAAVDYIATNHRNDTVSWYVSGGTAKNGSTRSEAELMADIISGNNNNQTYSWDYIYDTRATNTAENFIIATKNVDFNDYDDIFVTTSRFHHRRAKLIADSAIPTNRFQWILGDAELSDSRYWETVHIRNVRADVERAKMVLCLV